MGYFHAYFHNKNRDTFWTQSKSLSWSLLRIGKSSILDISLGFAHGSEGSFSSDNSDLLRLKYVQLILMAASFNIKTCKTNPKKGWRIS